MIPTQNNFSVVESPDEFTVVVTTARGPKEFQFDQMFTPDHTQEQVFEDTRVCIPTVYTHLLQKTIHCIRVTVVA